MTLNLTMKQAAHLQQRNLLSLLLQHQIRRSAMQQLHSHLITTGAHSHCMDVTSWNVLLRHYSLVIFPQEAFLLFRHLRLHHVSPPLSFDSFTFSFLLKACANLQHREGGLQLHALTFKLGFEFHVYVHTVMLNVYAASGAFLEAKQVFDEMPAVNMVKKMPAYKNRLWSLELEHTGGATNKKKTHKQMNKKMEEELSKELELQMKGAKKTLYIWELIGVHIVLLPLVCRLIKTGRSMFLECSLVTGKSADRCLN
ncbi:pentatricopeptide repeat-containing protein At1g09220, mitochondrial [Vitis vinifera]|uniref:pentatricopeptide repeat-containing protein At1g09220, mitochondrial n=1 Tax=Vitis vinifera TaxID=29760 RepID=UPI0008FF8E42|nr:pentatricopeptide repeat-containing protein At1g09220, mitochondrial [Vitis vinifera]|eukprot:XP_019073970.1 PREDICTED: pentatricopeptide repeat-containing protein At1g09220, mitochondrial [Vitis vinifera]